MQLIPRLRLQILSQHFLSIMRGMAGGLVMTFVLLITMQFWVKKSQNDLESQ
jgi:hypothetical protein